jgi:hypothetical protein
MDEWLRPLNVSHPNYPHPVNGDSQSILRCFRRLDLLRHILSFSSLLTLLIAPLLDVGVWCPSCEAAAGRVVSAPHPRNEQGGVLRRHASVS